MFAHSKIQTKRKYLENKKQILAKGEKGLFEENYSQLISGTTSERKKTA